MCFDDLGTDLHLQLIILADNVSYSLPQGVTTAVASSWSVVEAPVYHSSAKQHLKRHTPLKCQKVVSFGAVQLKMKNLVSVVLHTLMRRAHRRQPNGVSHHL